MCVCVMGKYKEREDKLKLVFFYPAVSLPQEGSLERTEKWVTGIKSCSDQDKRSLRTIFHRGTRLTLLTGFMDFSA